MSAADPARSGVVGHAACVWVSFSHYQSTLDAVYVYVVKWSEFPPTLIYDGELARPTPLVGHAACARDSRI